MNKDFAIRFLKQGVDPEKIKWVKIKTIKEFFEFACKLSEKDREKFIGEFSESMETMLSLYDVVKEKQNISPKDMGYRFFQWSNDIEV